MRIVVAHPAGLMTGRAHDVFLFKECAALAEAGHEVTFLFGRTTTDEDELFRYHGRSAVDGLHLVQLPMLRRRRWPRLAWNLVFYRACLKRLRRMLAEDTIDVLYLSSVRLAEFLMRRLELGRVPLVLEIHNLATDDPTSPDASLTASERFVFESVSALVTTTDALAAAIVRLGGLEREVIKVRMATDLPDVPARVPGRTPKRITYTGQLYPLQGIEVAIEAMVELPDCELHLVGGRERDIARLKTLARELSVSERTVFHGHVAPAAVPGFMALSDVLILPSRDAERMPVVAHTKLYEYLAAGRPIVASNLPSIAEEVTDGTDAVLVMPDDSSALAGGIRQVIEDPVLAGRIAERARRRTSEFTWTARADELTRIFESKRDTDD